MVSVCMASYNGERFIKQQIDSILMQMQHDDELIISDDGSTDKTVEVIAGINDARIKLFTGNKFRDPIRNFQFALRQTSGSYIFLSDQDDVWVKDKYKKMMDLLIKYDLVISDSAIVNEKLEVIHPSFFKYFNSGKGILKNMIKSSYYGSCMAFTRKLMQKALPFPDTKEIGHDLWLGLVAEMTGEVYFYEESLLLYRRHTDVFTSEIVGKSKRKKFQMLLGRIVMIKEVCKFFIKNKLRWKKD